MFASWIVFGRSCLLDVCILDCVRTVLSFGCLHPGLCSDGLVFYSPELVHFVLVPSVNIGLYCIMLLWCLDISYFFENIDLVFLTFRSYITSTFQPKGMSLGSFAKLQEKKDY